MQTFKKFITEFSSERSNELGGSLEVNNATLADPAVRKRLNAIVGQIGNAEYMIFIKSLGFMLYSLHF